MRIDQRCSIAFLLALLCLPAFGQIPDTLGFQGRLNRPGQGPVDGTFAITFNIYDQKTGGVPLFTESHPNVVVTKGRFSVELGSVDSVNNALSASLDFAEKYFLGVTVAGDSEMSPRLPFNSVAYAQRAAAATRADEAQESERSDDAGSAESISATSVVTVDQLSVMHINADQRGTVGALCPLPPSSGQKYVALGGGFSVPPQATDLGILTLALDTSRPADFGNRGGWQFIFTNRQGADRSVEVTTYVTCLLVDVS